MDHQYHVCDDEHCNICNGGLAWCVICHGAEGSLTTECCGRALSEEEQHNIHMKQILNYRDGQWRDESVNTWRQDERARTEERKFHHI